MWLIGTRNQVRDAIDVLTFALAIPREGATLGGARVDGARTARYSDALRLADGRWCCSVRADDVALLPVELAPLVLPIDMERGAGDVSTLDGSALVPSSAWMRPVIVRATIVDLPQDMPFGEGVEHLWDTSEPDPLGTRYVRADGEREFVVQQIANSTDHVFVLWFGGDSADPNETDYSRAMIAAAVAAGVVLESVECVYDSGAWLVGEMEAGSTIASRWPASWRVWQPGDTSNPSGARCIREVALVS
jgi:hypothetical protein